MRLEKKHTTFIVAITVVIVVVVYFLIKKNKEANSPENDLGAIYDQIPEKFYPCNDGTYSSTGYCNWHQGRAEGEAVEFATAQELIYQGLTVSPVDIYAVWLPISQIKTDTDRFQNREEDFSQESVKRIIENFDHNLLDPVTVWRDVHNQIWMLSGHSRLEAHKQLRKKVIPARFFVGTEKTAIDFSRFYANRGQTPEKLIEDIKIFKRLRDEEKLSVAELKNRFEGMYNKLELYSYLNPQGDFIRYLSLPKNQQDQFPLLEIKAMWIGTLKKLYPLKITNAHEAELFRYLYQSAEGSKLKKDDFFFKVSQVINRIDFNSHEPLALERKGDTGIYARSDTGESAKRIKEIDLALRNYNSILKNDRKADKERITATVNRLLQERDYLSKGISESLKQQTSLFGIKIIA